MGRYRNATGAVVQSWMPEHWYSNQYLVGSQTGGGYGGRGFFDEKKLGRKGKKERQATGEDGGEATEAEAAVEFHFTSGGYQGSIGTPEAGTSGEWCACGIG